MSPNQLIDAIIREGSLMANMVSEYRRQFPNGIDIANTCGNLGSSVKESFSETSSQSV